MTIRPKGNSFVLDVTADNKRQRINFSSRKEAELAEAKLNYAILAGDDVNALLINWRKRKTALNGMPNKNATLKDVFETTYKRYWQGLPKTEELSEQAEHSQHCFAIYDGIVSLLRCASQTYREVHFFP